MKLRRQTVLSLLVVGVLATSGIALAADSFTDVPDDHLFHDDIQWMKDNEITRGCNPPENTLYCPEENVTRGQMAAFMHRLALSVEGEQGPQGEPGPVGPEGPQGEPGQALVAHAMTDPDDPPIPNVQAVEVPGGGSGAQPSEDDVIVEVTVPEPGTYKVEGVVQFFDFDGDGAEDDLSEYGYAQTIAGSEVVGSLWTADLPDDGDNGAMASGSQIVETTEPDTVIKVVGVVRGGDGGVAGGNLIVTQFND